MTEIKFEIKLYIVIEPQSMHSKKDKVIDR